MKGQTYVIVAIIVLIIVAVFAVINVEAVEVNYLFGTGAIPLILLILFSVLMGGIITASAGAVKVFRLQRENKALQSENSEMKKNFEMDNPPNSKEDQTTIDSQNEQDNHK
ncbi:lipopolysaccharide assembly LapA domain-containing protein [Virgibacillus byunsanensis]|uniref:Lipopolysaccharide assembly LapA domain-containing protein n=1 Tax=Virgibacillus byunsanensis TaxID=570945 RepID=A0ABW3LMN6_9BACI